MESRVAASSQDPISKLKVAGFEISAAPEASGWSRAVKNGGAILFRPASEACVEMLRSAGLWRRGKIFRVLDKGFQKFLTDDVREIPATAKDLQQIDSFYQDFKDTVGMPVLFNEALGALTAVTNLDRVERPVRGNVQSKSH